MLNLDAALEGKEDPLQNGSGMHQPTNQGGPNVPRAVDEVSLAVVHELAAASAAQIPGHSFRLQRHSVNAADRSCFGLPALTCLAGAVANTLSVPYSY